MTFVKRDESAGSNVKFKQNTCLNDVPLLWFHKKVIKITDFKVIFAQKITLIAEISWTLYS